MRCTVGHRSNQNDRVKLNNQLLSPPCQTIYYKGFVCDLFHSYIFLVSTFCPSCLQAGKVVLLVELTVLYSPNQQHFLK